MYENIYLDLRLISFLFKNSWKDNEKYLYDV